MAADSGDRPVRGPLGVRAEVVPGIGELGHGTSLSLGRGMRPARIIRLPISGRRKPLLRGPTCCRGFRVSLHRSGPVEGAAHPITVNRDATRAGVIEPSTVRRVGTTGRKFGAANE